MTQRVQNGVWLAPAAAFALLLCSGAALAQPDGKSDQRQGKQMEGQGSMVMT